MKFVNFIYEHRIAFAFVGSVIASSMPPPTDQNVWYQWLYKTVNSLAANVTAVRGKAAFDPPKTPSLNQMSVPSAEPGA